MKPNNQGSFVFSAVLGQWLRLGFLYLYQEGPPLRWVHKRLILAASLLLRRVALGLVGLCSGSMWAQRSWLSCPSACESSWTRD